MIVIEIDSNEMQAIEGGNGCSDFFNGVAVGLGSRSGSGRRCSVASGSNTVAISGVFAGSEVFSDAPSDALLG